MTLLIVSDWVGVARDSPTSRRFEGRAAFIVQLAAIRAEVESGVSMSIYDSRKATLEIGYRYFHQLVARHIGLARDRFSDRANPMPPPTPPSPGERGSADLAPGHAFVRVGPGFHQGRSSVVLPAPPTPTATANCPPVPRGR